ncbi:MAG TPA: DUF397 domain-containing protein [Mycobacteriales bacterium]|nr:DUF397 domain-containing protein [Mycobacteriales bacterium]
MENSGIADAPFRKSSFSAPDAGCVEVGVSSGRILVRDTKDRGGAVLAFTEYEWNAFVRGVQAGEFDLPL